MELFDHLFRTEEVEKMSFEPACLQAMLEFEAALATAEAHAGVIPSSAATGDRGEMQSAFVRSRRVGTRAKLAGILPFPS